jgi:hypothetical protein
MWLSRGRSDHELLTVVQLARTLCTGDSGSSPDCLSDAILTPVIGTNNRFSMMKLEAIGCLGVERPHSSRALLGCRAGSNPAAETIEEFMLLCQGGGIGIHARFKILCPVRDVRVQLPPLAPYGTVGCE